MAPFFYWYDDETGLHLRNADGSFQVTGQPPLVIENNRTPGFSYRNKDWIRGQLLDMKEAGIDIALAVWFGHENNGPWGEEGLRNILEVALELEQEGRRPPRIGLFFDTSSFTFEEDGRNPGQSWTLDLTERAHVDRFYEMIRHFWAVVCEQPYARQAPAYGIDLAQSRFAPLLARIDGFPVVVIYEAGRGNFFSDWDQSLFETILARFVEDFGVKPRLFPDYEWSFKDPDDDATPFALNGGGYVRWRAAVYEPFCIDDPVQLPRKGADAIQFGPGYDDRSVPGRTSNGSPVRSRDHGLFYNYGWQYAMRAEKRLVMIESWNELHEGTQIADTRQHGRKYIDLTRRLAREFKRDYAAAETVWCRLRGSDLNGLSVINDERGLYQVDGGVLCSLDQPYGEEELDYLFEAPPKTEGASVATWKNGSPCRRTDLPQHPLLYFDIKDEFLRGAPETLHLLVEYCDVGQDSWRLRLGDGGKTSRTIEKTGTGQWLQATFTVNASELTNALGQDINHMIYQKVGCDFAIDALGDGDEFIRLVAVSRSKPPLDFSAESLDEGDLPTSGPVTLRIDAPSWLERGQQFEFTVSALSADGSVNDAYRGEVRFPALSQADLMPGPYRFTNADAGVRRFQAVLGRYGESALQVQDVDQAGLRARHDLFAPVPRCEILAEEKPRELGLHRLSCSSDNPWSVERNGQWCFSSTADDGKIVFDANDQLYHDLGDFPSYYHLYVTIEYLDAGQGRFQLVYDSNDEFDPPAGEKIARTQVVQLTDTGQWRRATIYLEDPRFINRCSGGDFLIDDLGRELFVRYVGVSVAPMAERRLRLELKADERDEDQGAMGEGESALLVSFRNAAGELATDYSSRVRLLSAALDEAGQPLYEFPHEVLVAPEDGGQKRIVVRRLSGPRTDRSELPPENSLHVYDLADPLISSFSGSAQLAQEDAALIMEWRTQEEKLVEQRLRERRHRLLVDSTCVALIGLIVLFFWWKKARPSQKKSCQ